MALGRFIWCFDVTHVSPDCWIWHCWRCRYDLGPVFASRLRVIISSVCYSRALRRVKTFPRKYISFFFMSAFVYEESATVLRRRVFKPRITRSVPAAFRLLSSVSVEIPSQSAWPTSSSVTRQNVYSWWLRYSVFPRHELVICLLCES